MKNIKTNYIIRKSPGLGYKHTPVARVEIDEQGNLHYTMLTEDKDVEQVLLRAQKEGGLTDRVPFSLGNNKEGPQASGLREEFIKITDDKYFANAIETNLKNGMVDKEIID